MSSEINVLYNSFISSLPIPAPFSTKQNQNLFQINKIVKNNIWYAVNY